MKVVVTGAGGFLGARLADWLLSAAAPLPLSELLLVDCVEPAPRADPRARSLQLDLAAPGAADRLLEPGTDVLFHLAAVVSGRAEEDLDLGLRVNLDATRALLEAAAAARARRGLRGGAEPLVLVFASSVAVFGPCGGEEEVRESTAPAPRTSYGAAKAAAELLVADYTRRGLVDGRSLRLPTVTVRGGAPNTAITSFASGLVREPLRGSPCIVPVPPERELWVASPDCVVRNIARAALVPGPALGARRVLNLPGLRVSVREAVAALAARAAPAASLVRYEPDETIDRMVASLPVRFDDSLARSLGFEANSSFAHIVQEYIDETELS